MFTSSRFSLVNVLLQVSPSEEESNLKVQIMSLGYPLYPPPPSGKSNDDERTLYSAVVESEVDIGELHHLVETTNC